MTALMIAAYEGHEACVRVLIAANFNMAHKGYRGETALHYAAKYGHASTCRVLIDEGASLTATNDDGKTPLELAEQGGKAECVAVLESPTLAAIKEAAAAEIKVRKRGDKSCC